MGKRIRIKAKKPWIAYPGSTIQQSYAEDLEHGYLLWDIESKDSYDVKFHGLVNPKPFITVNWEGTVEKTLHSLGQLKLGSRIRVKSNDYITQKDVQELTNKLTSDFKITEITFKIDNKQDNSGILKAGGSSIVKEDLRNPSILIQLMKDYYSNSEITDNEWCEVQEKLGSYIQSVASVQSPRNIVWSLKNFKFDNLFSYGTDNIIDFEKLNGVVGIFGPNRSGKSSIPGSIMYTMFNGTDRGSVKNQNICNIRSQYCTGRCIFNISGIDYVVERQTTKSETKRGVINSSTALNLYRVTDDNQIVDLAGEARLDTEKEVRKLVGTSADFLVTTFAAQGEMNQFINHGSTQRWALISRFLDLDIFKQLYDLAKQDVNITKAMMKKFPEKDWDSEKKLLNDKIVKSDLDIENLQHKLIDAKNKISTLRTKLSEHNNVSIVSETQVAQQQFLCSSLNKKIQLITQSIIDLKSAIKTDSEYSGNLSDLISQYDIDELKQLSVTVAKLKNTVTSITHSYETENSRLNTQKKSLKILDQVPCDDKFPDCKFIKDAHINKEKIKAQLEKTESLKLRLKDVSDSLDEVLKHDVDNKLLKLDELSKKLSSLKLKISSDNLTLSNLESKNNAIKESLLSAKETLDSLEQALSTDENIEVISLKSQITKYEKELIDYDQEKTRIATEKGRIESSISSLDSDHKLYINTLQELKIYELIAFALSKKGIPNFIVSSQLPLINAEIAKILSGVVDFTVELETDNDSEDIQIYLNYGDSKRILELGSGMEKMLSSIALRVSLINVSTLPKTDMLIIDEGFGQLDETSIEAVTRMLESLKNYFRTILIISHIDSVKDVADHVIEITKRGKDAKIVYE